MLRMRSCKVYGGHVEAGTLTQADVKTELLTFQSWVLLSPYRATLKPLTHIHYSSPEGLAVHIEGHSTWTLHGRSCIVKVVPNTASSLLKDKCEVCTDTVKVTEQGNDRIIKQILIAVECSFFYVLKPLDVYYHF